MNAQILMNQKLENAKKVAVVNCSSVEQACKIVENLIKNNIFALEIAYRNLSDFSLTDKCISEISKRFPQVLVGAATVINKKLAKRAVKAGAKFILSPGFNEKTVKWCLSKKIPIYPGVLTPSEIEKALEFNLNYLKLFPVENFGGIKFLNALKGPFPQVKFIVSGGISSENENEYQNLSNVFAVSGSYLSKF